MKNIIENEVGAILTDILDDYKKGRAVDKMDIYNQPDKTEIMDILDRLFSIVYPGFFRDKTHKIYNIEHSVSTMIEDVMFHLNKQICVVLKYTKEFGDNEEEKLEQFAQKATVSFMRRIPKVREYLETILLHAAKTRSYFLIRDFMPSRYTVWRMSCFCLVFRLSRV